MSSFIFFSFSKKKVAGEVIEGESSVRNLRAHFKNERKMHIHFQYSRMWILPTSKALRSV